MEPSSALPPAYFSAGTASFVDFLREVRPDLLPGAGARAVPSTIGASQLLLVVTLVNRPSAQNSILPAPIPPSGIPLSSRRFPIRSLAP